MTEKRFTYWEEENGEFPFPYIKDSDGKDIISLYECCECMNALHEENEQLKKIIEDNVDFKTIFSDRDLNDICNEMGYELSENEIKLRRLEKENEQLKSELRNLRRLANELYMEGSE